MSAAVRPRSKEQGVQAMTSRRFHLQRNIDATGTSGTGLVAVGCQFPNGWCALTWLTVHTSVAFYPNIEALEYIHGHNGSTLIVWDDPEHAS